MRAGLLALLLGLAGPALAAEPQAPSLADVPRLLEQGEEAGVSHVYGGPWEFFVGGGVAAFDCNADGKPDLFFAGGKNPAKLYLNRSPVGGALRFEARQTGLSAEDEANILGAYPLDIDGDGFTDLALARLGRNLILKGGADCAFEVWNRGLDFDGGRAWTAAFAATWEKGNRFPTLAFGNYVDRSLPGSPWGTCHDNDLYRPQEGKAPNYGEKIALSPGFCTLSMLFTDWNRTGETALRIANDRHYYRDGEEQLWRLDPGRPPRLYSRADGWRSLKIWGMGIAVGDLAGDGKPGYAITSMGDTKLQVLDPEAEERRPVYRDVAVERGATAHRPYTGGDLKPSTGWHVALEDFNNDSRLDLYVAKGNVEAMPDFASFDPDNLLISQWDGKYREVGEQAGIALPTKGRGAAAVDLNLDGMLDLVVVNREQPATLFRNLGGLAPEGGTRPLGNWLQVRLKDENGNLWGIGAEISVKTGTRTQVRHLVSGGGHASGALGWTHLGLGTAERAEIRVRWPDGDWSHPYRVFANHFVVIERGAKAAAFWFPQE